MAIASIGSGLAAVLPHLVGMAVDEMFTLTRPLIEFTMENVRFCSVTCAISGAPVHDLQTFGPLY